MPRASSCPRSSIDRRGRRLAPARLQSADKDHRQPAGGFATTEGADLAEHACTSTASGYSPRAAPPSTSRTRPTAASSRESPTAPRRRSSGRSTPRTRRSASGRCWRRRIAVSILLKVQELMQERRDELARLVTLENGKPYEEARKEVQFALGYFGWFAEEARRMTGEWIPSPQPGKRYWVLAPADRAGRRGDAVELPGDDGHAQDRARARRRLHRRAQARVGDAAHRARHRAHHGSGGTAAWCVQRAHDQPLTSRRRRAAHAPADPQDRLHRVDRRGQGHHGDRREAGDATLLRARRQRALHRVRRRRLQGGARGRGGDEVPARRRAVVHLREPDLRPARHRRAVHPGVRRRGGEAEGGAGLRAGRPDRSADQRGDTREGALRWSRTRSSTAPSSSAAAAI